MSGRYKILEELGAGGAGSVCKAYDTQLNRYVALKRLLTKEEEQQQDPQSSSLKNEAASLATLQHPNIVTIYDLASDESGLFIVMELLEGDTLSDWIQGGIMSLGDFYELATQTLEGVLSAHGQSILHRDLKPENMKVKRLPGGRLQVKIVDFGLARLSYGAKKQTEDHRGHILGSIFYMAPEQFLRRPLDGRTDLYSLGCVYFQVLSGRRPFQAKSVSEVMDLHLKHHVTLLHDLRPDLPSQLCDWVMWLMNGDPAGRPANAQQALESLRGLAATGVLADVGAASESATAQAISSSVARPATSSLTPRTTSSQQPARRTTSSMSARPASGASSGARPLPRSPQYQGNAYPTTGRVRKNSLAWLYIVIVITALAGGGVYYLKKKRESADPGAAPSNAGAPSSTTPASGQPVAPGDTLLAGSIIHWLAGENMDVWSDDPASAPVAKSGDLILRWHDLGLGKGDAVLSACDRRKENCPTYLDEHLGDLKDKFSMLRFDTGKCMAHRAIKESKKNYPFGENAKDKGMTLFLIVRPRIGGHEVTLTKLLSQDGKGWLRLQAFSNNEFRAQAGVKQPDGQDIVKECKVRGRSTKVFSLISLRWDPAARKMSLTVRSGTDGAKTRAEGDVPPGCPALTDIHVSEFSKDSAKSPAPETLFTGDIHEFILWPFLLTQDQHADEAQKLAERYFKYPGSKW
ncbi:MAG TPA: protein kinase [Verrucomicrobiaceae bacterium]